MTLSVFRQIPYLSCFEGIAEGVIQPLLGNVF